MFERFTESSRRVVVLAQEEARMLDHDYIGTEHILLGLIHERNGVSARALASLGLTLQTARDQVTDMIGRGRQTPAGHIPFTPRAKKVLELSLREALALQQEYIGPEHLLLGLVREGDGVGAQILAVVAPLPTVRERVLELAAAAAETGRDEPLTAGWPNPGSPGAALRQGPRAVVGVRGQLAAESQQTLAAIAETLAAIERRLGGIERQLGISAPADETGPAPDQAAAAESPQ